jgi:hypothetical protein
MTLLARESDRQGNYKRPERLAPQHSPDPASPPVAISASLDPAKNCDTLQKIAISAVLHKLTQTLALYHFQ